MTNVQWLVLTFDNCDLGVFMMMSKKQSCY